MERSPGSGIFWPERLVGWLLLSADQSGCWGNGGPRERLGNHQGGGLAQYQYVVLAGQ